MCWTWLFYCRYLCPDCRQLVMVQIKPPTRPHTSSYSLYEILPFFCCLSQRQFIVSLKNTPDETIFVYSINLSMYIITTFIERFDDCSILYRTSQTNWPASVALKIANVENVCFNKTPVVWQQIIKKIIFNP